MYSSKNVSVKPRWWHIPLMLTLERWKVGLGVQIHPRLHRELKVSLSNMKPCLKKHQPLTLPHN